MKQIIRRIHNHFHTFFSLAFIFILCACAGGPSVLPYERDMSFGAWLAVPPPERGALIAAVPLRHENIAATLDLLRPEVIRLKANAAPIVEAGFFRMLEARKPSLHGVRTLRVHYWSADSRGRPIRLSGAFYLPVAEGIIDVPLLLLCHGTQVLRERVPSRLQGGERPVAILLAASGIAVALPDYPGLGDGEGFHTYCHARSLGHAGVDMLRALRTALRLPEAARLYREASAVFIGGYSEGGYAAMAVARELETDAKNEFRLKAVFPMAGPFDMSGIMRLLMLSDDPIPAPYYLPYTILGWASSHAALDPVRIIRREYMDVMLPVFDGRHPAVVINAALAKAQGADRGKVIAKKMLTDEALLALTALDRSEFGGTLAAALRENDLWDWPADPAVPLYFMATKHDELVPYENEI